MATDRAPSPLEDRLKERMAGGRLLTYDAFLETVLYDERYGYYKAGKQPGQDYFTAPEIHALFGRTIGKYVEAVCRRSGSASVTVLELGGASGKMAADIAAAFDRVALDAYFILEKGEERTSGPIRWINDLGKFRASEGLTFIVANEFFDALPFHRVINRDGKLEEIYVGHEQGFFEERGPLSPPLASFLEEHPLFLQEQHELEATPATACLVKAASAFTGKGCFLVFDYGYHQVDVAAGRFFQGSMLGYRNRRMREDVFDSLGRMDITHHVNFDHLAALLEEEGWRKDGEIEQYRFLLNAGALEKLGELSAQERMTVKWLITPEGLGSAISVLGFARGLAFGLPGF